MRRVELRLRQTLALCNHAAGLLVQDCRLTWPYAITPLDCWSRTADWLSTDSLPTYLHLHIPPQSILFLFSLASSGLLYVLFPSFLSFNLSRDSSVGIVTALYRWAVFRFPARVRDIRDLHIVQIGCGTRTASYTIHTELKRPELEGDSLSPSSTCWARNTWSSISISSFALMADTVTLSLCQFLFIYFYFFVFISFVLCFTSLFLFSRVPPYTLIHLYPYNLIT